MRMLWMCVLYVSFGSKLRPRTFGCIAMGSALLLGCIFGRVRCEQSASCLSGLSISWLHSYL